MPSAKTSGTGSATTRRPRVLLVDPYLAREDPMERRFVELYPSLGLLTLGAYLRSHGCDVSVVDLTFARDTRPVETAIHQLGPDIVGVHTKTLTHGRAAEIARMARAAGVRSVAGGPDSASRPEFYLDAGFEFVVTGEGEATLVALAQALASESEIAGMPGVVLRHAGRTVRGPPGR